MFSNSKVIVQSYLFISNLLFLVTKDISYFYAYREVGSLKTKLKENRKANTYKFQFNLNVRASIDNSPRH